MGIAAETFATCHAWRVLRQKRAVVVMAFAEISPSIPTLTMNAASIAMDRALAWRHRMDLRVRRMLNVRRAFAPMEFAAIRRVPERVSLVISPVRRERVRMSLPAKSTSMAFRPAMAFAMEMVLVKAMPDRLVHQVFNARAAFATIKSVRL